MSKDTINVFVINSVDNLSPLSIGDVYVTTMKKGSSIKHRVIRKSMVKKLRGKNVAIKYKISCDKKHRDEFIKHIRYSVIGNPYIIIVPNKKQDIILDFTLNVEEYCKLSKNLKLIK